MFGFFVMGFVDIVGITTSYVKNDFSHLTDTMVNLISLSCFLWFLVLSIPTGMLMNRIGRKKTVLLSFAFHVLAMCLPLVAYDFTAILIAFALIGIGNTLLQVSLNPLVTDVVANDKLTGTLTLGQFVKAVSSFLGPILAAWVTGSFFGWKMIFPIYAGLSLLALIWLWLTPIQEKQQERKNISFKVTLELFKDKYILAFFIGILVLVGVDVGINMTFPKFLMERCDLPLTDAGMGNSVYFFARTVGAFLGGILLMKYSESKFYIYSVWIALAGLILMTISTNLWFILAAWVTGSFFGWKMIFPIYAGLSLLALIWLWLTPIQEKQQERKNISFKVTLELFKDKYILAFFIGILVLVGVDVGINMTFPKFLMERCDLPLTDAGMGNSVYFFARTVGAFLGGILLMKYSESKFYIYSVWIALAGLILMTISTNLWFILGCVAVFGIGYANLFSIIFSLSLKRVPEKANEVSALLIVGVSGGAVLPPILGVITDSFHSQLSAIIVLAIVWCYLIGIMRKIKTT